MSKGQTPGLRRIAADLANMAGIAPCVAPDDADAIAVTQLPPDGREARLRALFALFFYESGFEPVDSTISALAATTHRLGFAIVPVRR